MAVEDFLAPKPNEQLLTRLFEMGLDSEFLNICKENDLAYAFVSGYISNIHKSNELLVKELNGLTVIIQKLSK